MYSKSLLFFIPFTQYLCVCGWTAAVIQCEHPDNLGLLLTSSALQLLSPHCPSYEICCKS